MAVLPTGRRQGARAGAEALLLFAGGGHAHRRALPIWM